MGSATPPITCYILLFLNKLNIPHRVLKVYPAFVCPQRSVKYFINNDHSHIDQKIISSLLEINKKLHLLSTTLIPFVSLNIVFTEGNIYLFHALNVAGKLISN